MSNTLEIQAQNIKCGGCASAIENGLKALPGVEQIDVAIDTGRVSIQGPALDESAIRAKLAELGYPAAD
jgi:copper chaperone